MMSNKTNFGKIVIYIVNFSYKYMYDSCVSLVDER